MLVKICVVTLPKTLSFNFVCLIFLYEHCFNIHFSILCFSRLKCSLSVFVFHFLSGGLGDSVILANDVGKISQLNTWLLPHLQSSDRSYWKLCYRATSHGWRGQTFHSYCDNKGPTVTIVRDGSYIFGGYNDNSWKCKSLKYGEHVAMTIYLAGSKSCISGCKGSRFYGLPFGQVVASMY